MSCAWADSKTFDKSFNSSGLSVQCEQSENIKRFRMNEVPDQIFSRSKIRPVRCEGRKSIRTRGVLSDVIYRISRIKQPSTLAYCFSGI